MLRGERERCELVIELIKRPVLRTLYYSISQYETLDNNQFRGVCVLKFVKDDRLSRMFITVFSTATFNSHWLPVLDAC